MASRNYDEQFDQFRKKVAEIVDAKGATIELSEEIRNVVVLSGQITGRDTHDRICKLGKEHGLLVIAQELSVLYRDPQ